MYIYLEKSVVKFLSKLEKRTSKRIIEKIESLKEKPIPKEAKKIVNINDKVFRIRVGVYRILYRLEDSYIVVFLIEKRKKAYRN